MGKIEMVGKNVLSNVRSKINIPNRLELSHLGSLSVIALLIVPIISNDPYFVHLLIQSMIFACLSMGFVFTSSMINIVNFGYAAFFGIGAYTYAILITKLGLMPWMAILAGGLAAGLNGLIMGILIMRARGIYATCCCWFSTSNNGSLYKLGRYDQWFFWNECTVTI